LARFVEFMHHWEANEKPEYMDIAFSSERSIEDELERETYGDIVTIGKPHGTVPSVADMGRLSRIRIFSILDPGSASKNLSILTRRNGL
jgi:hypothetical protein